MAQSLNDYYKDQSFSHSNMEMTRIYDALVGYNYLRMKSESDKIGANASCI